ncbi:MAG: hypothetical protein U0641_15760 [Anaerolineae bacterium]
MGTEAKSSVDFEQALLDIARTLPTYQRVQLLDFALLLQARLVATVEAKPVSNGDELDERLWSRAAIRSLAKDWDTPEEDEAWGYLREKT